MAKRKLHRRNTGYVARGQSDPSRKNNRNLLDDWQDFIEDPHLLDNEINVLPVEKSLPISMSENTSSEGSIKGNNRFNLRIVWDKTLAFARKFLSKEQEPRDIKEWLKEIKERVDARENSSPERDR